MAKKKLNTNLDQANDDVLEEVVLEDADVTIEDDTVYTMGQIVVDDGSSDGDDDDKQILSTSSNGKKGDDDDDDDGDDEEIWLDDVDVFDMNDDFLDKEDYDPEEASYGDD